MTRELRRGHIAGLSDPVRGMRPAIHLVEVAEGFLAEQDLHRRLEVILRSKWLDLLEPTLAGGLRRMYTHQVLKMTDLRAEWGIDPKPLKLLVEHLRSAGVRPRRCPDHRHIVEAETRLRAVGAMAEELGEELARKALRQKDEEEYG